MNSVKLQDIKYSNQLHFMYNEISEKERKLGFPVVQWIRICLPTQGTQVQSLVWEDPTCHGATKLLHHNY